MYPLSVLASNIRAKQNKDGTLFDFSEKDRERTFNLAFKVLRENRKFPRILQYVAEVFDKLRYINENQAKEVLNIFFYDQEGKLNPDYLTSHLAPLVFFFADFRKIFDKNFDNIWFQDFLKELIKEANKESPRLKTTLIWLAWKQIEEGTENLQLMEPYINLFFEGKFNYEPVGQFELLVDRVLDISYEKGLDLLKKELDYIYEGVRFNYSDKDTIWMITLELSLKKIADKAPKDLLDIFPKLFLLIQHNCYTGDINSILSIYKEIDLSSKEQLEPVVKQIIDWIKRNRPHYQLREDIL